MECRAHHAMDKFSWIVHSKGRLDWGGGGGGGVRGDMGDGGAKELYLCMRR